MLEFLRSRQLPCQHFFNGVMTFWWRTKGDSQTLLFSILVFSCCCHLTLATALCETRCETGTPHLQPLKVVWRKTIARMQNQDVTFEQFVASLVLATERDADLGPLRERLMRLMSQYRDCLKTCEYHHSKRNGLARRQMQLISHHGFVSHEDWQVYRTTT